MPGIAGWNRRTTIDIPLVNPVRAAPTSRTIDRTTNQRSLHALVTREGRRSKQPRITQMNGRLCLSSGGRRGNLKLTTSGRNISPPKIAMSAARGGRNRKKREIDTGTDSTRAIWEKSVKLRMLERRRVPVRLYRRRPPAGGGEPLVATTQNGLS